VATGRLVRTIATPTTAVAIGPNVLATADVFDGTIRVWSRTNRH
jgi:hypothetical protein